MAEVENRTEDNILERWMKGEKLVIRILSLFGGLFIFTFACAAAQAQTPNTVIAGPEGAPRLVRTEGEQWSAPIQVFSNADEIVYVPDISNSGWAQWHAADFKEKGLYFTYVYTYLRKQRVTVQETLYVNVRTQHAVVMRFLRPPITVDLHTAPPTLSKITANITKLVQDSIAHYHGPSLDDEVRAQKTLALQNLKAIEANEQGSPRAYATNVPRLINAVKPIYPEDALALHVSGKVTVGATIAPDGKPINIHIVKSVSSSLDAAALQAFSQSQFEPARNDITGAPISANVTLNYNF